MSVQLRNWLFFFLAIPLTAIIYYAPAHDQTLAPRFWGLSLFMALLFGAEIYRTIRAGEKIAWGWADLLFLIWYGWNLASSAWALNGAEAWFSSQKIGLAYAVFWFARRALSDLWQPVAQTDPAGPEKKNVDPWTALLAANFAGILIVGGYFWADLFRQADGNLTEFLSDPCNMGGNLYKLVGLSGHRNLNSGLMFMLMPLGVAAAVRWKGMLRWTVVAVLALLLAAIFILDSDAVFLSIGLAAGLGLLGWLAVEGFFYASDKHRKGFFATSALGGLLGLVLLITPLGGKFAEQLRESDTGRERLLLWYRTEQLVKENALLGVGAGNWQFLLPSKTLVGSYRLQEQHIFATRPHNDFLWVLSETGYIGLILWLGLLGYVFALGGLEVWRNPDRFSRLALLWTMAGLLGYCVFATFDFPKERIEHQTILSIWLALLASAGLVKTKRPLATWWTALPLGLLLLANVWMGYDRTRAEGGVREINRIKQDLSSLPQLNAQQYAQLAEYYGFDFNPGASAGEQRAQVNKGLWNSYLNIAEGLRSPLYTHDATTFPVSWHLAVPHYYLGDTTKALEFFALAYQEHPYHVDIANNYGSLLLSGRRFDDAIALYNKALEINPDFLDGRLNLSKAYFNKQSFAEAKTVYDSLAADWETKREKLEKKFAEEAGKELLLPSRCRGKYEVLKVLKSQKDQHAVLKKQMDDYNSQLLQPRLLSLGLLTPPQPTTPPTAPQEGQPAPIPTDGQR